MSLQTEWEPVGEQLGRNSYKRRSTAIRHGGRVRRINLVLRLGEALVETYPAIEPRALVYAIRGALKGYRSEAALARRGR